MRGLLFILLCLFNTAAQAVTVKVKAGEHDGFTRLVIYTNGAKEVDVSIPQDKIRINYGKRIDEVDTKQVFPRLQSDRIDAIYADDSALVIDLKCNCRVQKQRTEFGQIFFDISESDVTPASLPLFLNAPNFARPTTPATKPSYELERHLLESALVSAAETKILMPANSQTQVSNIDATDQKSVAIDLANLAVEERHMSERLENSSGVECLSADSLNFVNWADENSFTVQVSQHIKSLVREFDVVDIVSLEQLIKLYIFHGLGAEAIQLMNLYSEDVPQDLFTIAQLLHDPDAENSYFLGQETCNGPSALWSVISAKERLYNINSDQIFLAFSALPKNMKSILTEPLVAKLHENKFATTAQKILSLSQKTGPFVENHAELLIANSIEAPEVTLELIENELDFSTEISPDVAVKYITLKAQKNSSISQKFVKILEGVAWDYRNASQGAILENALMLAYLLSAEFDEFLFKMASVDWDPEYKLRAQELVHDNTPDDVFLRIVKSGIFAPNDRFQERLVSMGLVQSDPQSFAQMPVTRQPDRDVFPNDTPVNTAEIILAASTSTRIEMIDRLKALGIVF